MFYDRIREMIDARELEILRSNPDKTLNEIHDIMEKDIKLTSLKEMLKESM